MTQWSRILGGVGALLAVALVAACDRNYYYTNPAAPTAQPTTTPTPTPTPTPLPVVKPDVIEFLVEGSVTKPVTVRASEPLDGLTQVVTELPYFQSVSIAGRDQMFLSLDVRCVAGTGFLHAAIFVNGVLFREGSSTQVNPVVSLNGTYRH